MNLNKTQSIKYKEVYLLVFSSGWNDLAQSFWRGGFGTSHCGSGRFLIRKILKRV